MKVTVFGGGYVGLCSAAVLAKAHDVTIVDIDSEKVHLINLGNAPIAEDGLELLIRKGISQGRLRAVLSEQDLQDQDAVLICVDTPSDDGGLVNLSRVESVVNTIESSLHKLLHDYLLIGVRSTVPPGTTRSMVCERFRSYIKSNRIGVVFQPEFLRQGHAIEDLEHPDRIVIGAIDDHVYGLYKSMVLSSLERKDTRIIRMEIESAEMCKYASNSFLATKISFVNELSALAERLDGVDIEDVVEGMTADHRIHPSHLKPGLGYGGSCLPKDVIGFLLFGQQKGVQMRLLNAVHSVNRNTTDRLFALLSDNMDGLRGAKVAVLGVAFKADTDDTRESSSLFLIRRLLEEGMQVSAHDPRADLEATKKSSRLDFRICQDVRTCVAGAKALFLMTDWDEYQESGLSGLTKEMNGSLVIDGRRMFVHSEIPEGIDYRPLGTRHKTLQV